MTTLTFEKVNMPSASFGGESSLLILGLKLVGGSKYEKYDFPEDEGLYMNYGKVYCAFPYKSQDMYDRALEDTEYRVAVLENENLKVTFFPSLGGKLWSLIDKKTGRGLLFLCEKCRKRKKFVDAQKLEVRKMHIAKAEKLRIPHKRKINRRGISVRV